MMFNKLTKGTPLKKIVLLLAAIVMVLPILASCQNTQSAVDANTDIGNTGEATVVNPNLVSDDTQDTEDGCQGVPVIDYDPQKIREDFWHTYVGYKQVLQMLGLEDVVVERYLEDIDSWESKISTELWKALVEKPDDALIPVWLGLQGVNLTDAFMNSNGMTRLEIIKREFSAFNDKFVADNIGEKPREILYNSRVTPTLIVEATKTEILDYARNELVHDISLYMTGIVMTCSSP